MLHRREARAAAIIGDAPHLLHRHQIEADLINKIGATLGPLLGQEKFRERGMALGASAYVLKPLREMELARTLMKLVPQALQVARPQRKIVAGST